MEEKEEVKDQVNEEVKVESKEEPTKIKVKNLDKAKPKNKRKKKKEEVVKIDLKKLKDDASEEQEPSALVDDQQAGDLEKVEEKIRETEHQQLTEEGKKEEKQVTPILEVVNEEEENVFKPTENTQVRDIKDLPENVEKLVDFMNETGGTVEDYVRLNSDYSNVDENVLLKEYYSKHKPHLSKDEIEFMIEDSFDYDEDYDDERQIRKKRLAKKEEVAKALNYLDDLKSKYYTEIKSKSGLNEEQKKAIDFFNKYNEEQKIASRNHDIFKQSTVDFFSERFKGFDFNVGDKKFRYNVKNGQEVAAAQSDISTFIKKFLNEDGSVKDYDGYHKAMYAARNADTIAQHFYEQGKADAVKNVVASSKNINNEARKQAPNDSIFLNGMRITGVSGADSSKLKIRNTKK